VIIKTARKLEIGDELLPWANSDEEHDEFEKRIEDVQAELKAMPQGKRFITFIMRSEYRKSRPQNSKILYKRSVSAFNPKTGAPDYKDHTLKFNWGMIRTSNFEEIAFLDMHNDWFIREANRELSATEKLAKENEELKAKLAALQAIDKQKEEILKETESYGKTERQEERQEQEEEKAEENREYRDDKADSTETIKKIEKKEKQRGRPRKT